MLLGVSDGATGMAAAGTSPGHSLRGDARKPRGEARLVLTARPAPPCCDEDVSSAATGPRQGKWTEATLSNEDDG
jgi:hypothetical protein